MVVNPASNFSNDEKKDEGNQQENEEF